jgi:hypothetical protein
MPLYEGIGIGSDKHSVVIEMGQSFTKYSLISNIFKSNLINISIKKVWFCSRIFAPSYH